MISPPPNVTAPGEKGCRREDQPAQQGQRQRHAETGIEAQR